MVVYDPLSHFPASPAKYGGLLRRAIAADGVDTDKQKAAAWPAPPFYLSVSCFVRTVCLSSAVSSRLHPKTETWLAATFHFSTC